MQQLIGISSLHVQLTQESFGASNATRDFSGNAIDQVEIKPPRLSRKSGTVPLVDLGLADGTVARLNHAGELTIDRLEAGAQKRVLQRPALSAPNHTGIPTALHCQSDCAAVISFGKVGRAVHVSHSEVTGIHFASEPAFGELIALRRLNESNGVPSPISVAVASLNLFPKGIKNLTDDGARNTVRIGTVSEDGEWRMLFAYHVFNAQAAAISSNGMRIAIYSGPGRIGQNESPLAPVIRIIEIEESNQITEVAAIHLYGQASCEWLSFSADDKCLLVAGRQEQFPGLDSTTSVEQDESRLRVFKRRARKDWMEQLDVLSGQKVIQAAFTGTNDVIVCYPNGQVQLLKPS